MRAPSAAATDGRAGPTRRGDDACSKSTQSFVRVEAPPSCLASALSAPLFAPNLPPSPLSRRPARAQSSGQYYLRSGERVRASTTLNATPRPRATRAPNSKGLIFRGTCRLKPLIPSRHYRLSLRLFRQLIPHIFPFAYASFPRRNSTFSRCFLDSSTRRLVITAAVRRSAYFYGGR